jgi:hypothetical protein
VPISFSLNPAIVPGSRRIALSSLLQRGVGNAPEYLVLAGLDRHHPAAGQHTSQGSLQGNGKVYEITTPGSDCFGFGLVFTHTVRGYYNGTYGYLDELVFTPSSGNFRSEYLALYGFGKAGMPDVALRAQLHAELTCPLFDAGVFGIPELYPDAVHLGTLDLISWAVFSEARASSGFLGSKLSPTPRHAYPTRFAGSTWAPARTGESSLMAHSFQAA